MFSNISFERLSEVHPELSKRIQQLEQMLESEGIQIQVTQGLRSWNQQDALYSRGRLSLEQVNEKYSAVGWAPLTDAQNVIVTKAPPGYSWHNFGMAVDVAPFAGSIPDFDAEHPAWARIVSVGQSLGLVDGISWKDEPHFQLTGKFLTTPDDEVRQLFKDAGISVIWEAAGI